MDYYEHRQPCDPTQIGRFRPGAIESHRPALQTFVLQGVTVFYGAPGAQFDKGMAADLGPGIPVDVRGVLSSDGTRLLAMRIRFRI